MTGIRCFSASSSRKFMNSSEAPETALRMPSRFSCEEKYGLNRKTCRSRLALSVSTNSPSSEWSSSRLPRSSPVSKRASA
jgi:hypothetical protein